MNSNEMKRALENRVAEKQDISDASEPIAVELDALRAEMEEATGVIASPKLYESTKQKSRDVIEALRPQVARLTEKLRGYRARENEMDMRITELREKISRAEYESKSVTELNSDAQKILEQVRSIDVQVEKLNSEKNDLTAKQGQAEKALQLVESAREEFESAQAVLDEHQGENFIDGRNIDLSPYQARAGKAKGRLEELQKNAAGGRAALPKIANRLETINEDIAELSEARESLFAAWLVNRRRIIEVSIKSHANNIAHDVCVFGAIGRRTGSPISESLLDAHKRGLMVPVYGNRIERVDLSRYIGTEIVPDYSAILTQLTQEFEGGVNATGLTKVSA